MKGTGDSVVRVSIATGILLLAWGGALADGFWDQFVDPGDGRFDASSFLTDNAHGFLPVPIIITEPAVDAGLGAIGLFFHETEEQKKLRLDALRSAEDGSQFLLTPSISGVAAAATGNDSWFVGGGHMGFFKEGSVRYTGGAGYGDVNLDFYGFGEVDLTRPVGINTQAFAVMQTLKFRLGESSFFVGPKQQYVNARLEPRDLGFLSGDFLPPELQERWEERVRELLTQDVALSALGVVLEFDSRNNFFSPHAGYHYQLEQLWFRDALGSDMEYELTSFKGLNYWQLGDKFRAALRLDADYAAAENLLPPFATPAIQLRGIPAMRYQGNYVAVAETELTWQIDSRWSVLGFIGSGRAANSLDELKDSASRVSKGAGFRYLVAKRYGFEMGMDVGFGPDENVLYIQGGTAWR